MASSAAATTSSPDSNGSKQIFHRLVRTLSGKIIRDNEPTFGESSSPMVVATTPELNAPLERTLSSSSSASQTRVGLAERLKQLSNVPLTKLRRSSKSTAASPRISTSPLPDSGYGSSVATPSPGLLSPVVQSHHAKMLSMVAELVENEDSVSSSVPSSVPSSTNHPPDTPSPGTLARRLQDLIDALPFPNISTDRTTHRPPPVKAPKPPARDKDGRPIPPLPSPIKDKKLINLLSSATFMNGSKTGVKSRPSMWSILEAMEAPPHGFPPEDEIPVDGGDPSTGDDDSDIFSDNSSVMVYSPLIPGGEDIVELAELVPVVVEEEVQETPIPGTSWTAVWPLSIFYAEKSTSPPAEPTLQQRLSDDVVLSPEKINVDASGRKVKVQTVRAWVPSTTKLSLQAMWWGYRL